MILEQRSVGNFTHDGTQSVLQLSRQEAWRCPQKVMELGKGVVKEDLFSVQYFD